MMSIELDLDRIPLADFGSVKDKEMNTANGPGIITLETHGFPSGSFGSFEKGQTVL